MLLYLFIVAAQEKTRRSFTADAYCISVNCKRFFTATRHRVRGHSPCKRPFGYKKAMLAGTLTRRFFRWPAERKALLMDLLRQKCFCVTFAESNKGINRVVGSFIRFTSATVFVVVGNSHAFEEFAVCGDRRISELIALFFHEPCLEIKKLSRNVQG